MNYRWLSSVALLSLSLSCEGGPQGSTGPAGPAGSSPGTSPDCPDDYVQDATQLPLVVCQHGADEIVKVGKKGSAFWIDRYEASVWDKEDGMGTQYGANADDYPQSFPKNGQTTTSLYALSKKNVIPSRFLSWFQANEACRANGKRLATGDEWLAAARGTLDPGDSPGVSGACVTNASGPRNTGGGSKCTSDWGAQDMVGNINEWTLDWAMVLGSTSLATWPDASFNGDQAYAQLPPTPGIPGSTPVAGLPTAWIRGGDFLGKTTAGTFSFSLSISPSGTSPNAGFRCVIPR